MKPITPNTKPELKKIQKALVELTKSVNEIKSILTVTEPLHQIEHMYPWHSTNTTSAWSFPEEFFGNLTKKLQEISDDFELTVTVDEESEDFVGGGVGNKNGFAYVEEDEIEPLDYDNDDDEYIDEHWDMISEEKWSCVEAARNELQNES